MAGNGVADAKSESAVLRNSASPFGAVESNIIPPLLPSERPRLVLIRHGQTTANIDRILDTVVPGAPLSDKGVKQARHLGKLLLPSAQHFGEIVTSQALRARQTGTHAASGLHFRGCSDITVRTVAGLYEIQAGHVEGRNDKDAHRIYMEHFYLWLSGQLDKRLPGGESGADVLHRALPTLKQLLKGREHNDSDRRISDIVLVSHGATIRLIAQYLSGVDPKYALMQRIANTDRVELVADSSPALQPGTWRIERWGDSPLPDAEI